MCLALDEMRQSSRGTLYPLQQNLGIAAPEIASPAIPVQCDRCISLYPADMDTCQETGIVCAAKPQCRNTIPRRYRMFVKEPRRGQIAGSKKCIASRHEGVSPRSLEAWLFRRDLRDAWCRGH